MSYAADNDSVSNRSLLEKAALKAFANQVGQPLSSSPAGIGATQAQYTQAPANLPSAAEWNEPRGGRAVSQSQGAILGTPGPYVPTKQSTPTPDSGAAQLSALDQMLQGLNPDDMARQEFQAQFALLDQLAKQAQDRYAVANKDTGNMYEALAQSTAAQVPVSQQQYAASGDAIKNAYQGATDSVQKGSSQSLDQIGELLGRLGIQQAAPTVMAQTQDQLNKSLADIAQRSQGAQNLNTTLGQNQSDYLTRSVSTERQAGANAQADLTRQLQNILSDYDNKRLGLQGDQTAAANKYRLSIAGMLQDEQNRASDNAYKERQLALQEELGLGNLELGKSRLQADQDRYSQQAQQDAFDSQLRSQSALYNSKDAISITQNKAAQMYGDASEAAQATRDLLDMYQASNPQTMADFLGKIDESTMSSDALDRQRLKELGATFYMYMNKQ